MDIILILAGEKWYEKVIVLNTFCYSGFVRDVTYGFGFSYKG